MVKYRIQFTKTGDAKFVSHLDLVRLFSRVWRRAGLPLAYSEGFNPHPKMSIGLPLSVGVESECEFLDVELTDALPPDEIISRVNAVMPLGLTVPACAKIFDSDDPAVAGGFAKLPDITSAGYQVELTGGTVSAGQVKAFLSRDEIIVDKRTKKGVSPTDIKPDILTVVPNGDGTVLQMTLHAGSRANLKPDTVIEAMKLYIPDFSCSDCRVRRTNVYTENGKRII